MKKIGIVGSGVVGKTLAAGFIKHGYSVMIGTNTPGKLNEWSTKEGKGVTVGDFAATAAFGEIIVLAVKGTVALDALMKAGQSHLEGKTVIDATNPIVEAPPQNGVLKFFTTLDDSLMERLQRAFPKVKFVKAFSCVGNAFMVNPQFPGGKPSMFICGNDAGAKAETKQILDQFGWETEDMGTVEAARAIEPLCMLWCIPGISKGQWAHAFKLLKMS